MQRKTRHKKGKDKPVTLVCVTEKRGYKSQQSAMEHAELLMQKTRRTGQLKRAYQCTVCPWWHLTSQERNRG